EAVKGELELRKQSSLKLQSQSLTAPKEVVGNNDRFYAIVPETTVLVRPSRESPRNHFGSPFLPIKGLRGHSSTARISTILLSKTFCPTSRRTSSCRLAKSPWLKKRSNPPRPGISQ